ncbi:MAG: cation:proton antiporter [Solirubrobacterales bacterium]
MIPIGAGGDTVAPVFAEFGAILVGLALLARVLARFELSPIPAYLLLGVVIGSTDPLAFDPEFIDVGSQIGVVLLLFMLGLEYTADELKLNLQRGLPAGLVDAGLNFTPGLVLGLVLGWEPIAAVLLGGVTWISSSGVIAKTLADLDRLGNRETPSVLSLLVIEDLALAVYLPFVGAILVGGTALAIAGSVALGLGAAGGALILALRFGHTMSAAVSHRSDEVVLLTILGLILVIAAGAEQVQVSGAVGAFLLGIALSGSVAERARELLGPLRDLFAAVFFVFFGLQIDAGALVDVALIGGLLAVVTAATKMATGWFAARRAGVGEPGRIRAGAALVARGEFSIVIAGLGISAGVEPKLGSLAAVYVLMMALAGPLLARYSNALVQLYRRRQATTVSAPSSSTMATSGE